MKYYGLIIPRSYNDYFSRSDPQALKDVVAMSTDAQLDTESAAPIQNKAVAKLIPATASEENQLADKNFVNSTVGTNTANYIYKTDASGDNVPFESIEELEAYSGTVTNNDYAFVTGIDENGNKYFDRYKANVNGDAVTWAKEYRLNNSSFTAEQWASIESGITSELVAKIGDAGIVPITTADYNELSEEEKMSGKLYLLTDAQNGFITITDEVEAGNMSAVTSNAVNGALAELTTYSTEEKIVGKWIDGQKNIYEKTYDGYNIGLPKIVNVDTTLNRLNANPIEINGFIKNGQDGNWLCIGYGGNVSTRMESNAFVLESNYPIDAYILTLRYIKP